MAPDSSTPKEPAPRGLVAANGLVAIEGLLRIMRAAGDTYGHDYEAVLIYWSVALASIGRFTRNEDLIHMMENLGPLPEDAHHPVSARAIAEATGLPRETVRRKIAAMVAQGHLAQDSRGVRTFPPLIDQRGNLAFVTMAAREIKRMAGLMENMGHLAERTTPREPD